MKLLRSVIVSIDKIGHWDAKTNFIGFLWAVQIVSLSNDTILDPSFIFADVKYKCVSNDMTSRFKKKRNKVLTFFQNDKSYALPN